MGQCGYGNHSSCTVHSSYIRKLVTSRILFIPGFVESSFESVC